MVKQENLEVWLRGPLPQIPALLQPVAHALLQAREEVNIIMIDFPDQLLWKKPAGVASVGFHLQHLCGVLDRLFTYANAQPLSEGQLKYLSLEGKENNISSNELVLLFNMQVDKAIKQLIHTKEETLLQPRGVGRAQIPSTVLGLLFHTAEHTQRHVGQLLVTVQIVKSMPLVDGR
jgi:DinB family protein